MTQVTHKIVRNRIVLATLFLGIAGIASAGAPGTYQDGALNNSVRLIKPTFRESPAPQLSPAEIRNAVSIRMDRAAEQGFEVDRAAVDGIGLERRRRETLVEAPSP
jgi:hypothetical protein